jgi:hypothetical protein
MPIINFCKKKNPQIKRKKKCKSAALYEAMKFINLFLKFLKLREFIIFKNRFVGFYLHSAADLQFSSFQFYHLQVTSPLKIYLKEINAIVGYYSGYEFNTGKWMRFPL